MLSGAGCSDPSSPSYEGTIKYMISIYFLTLLSFDNILLEGQDGSEIRLSYKARYLAFILTLIVLSLAALSSRFRLVSCPFTTAEF